MAANAIPSGMYFNEGMTALFGLFFALSLSLSLS